MKLHKVFKRTSKASQFVSWSIRAGYYQGTAKLLNLRSAAARFSEIYGTETPAVELDPGQVPAGAFACYRPATRTIYLKNYSLVSFLHEYRHHLQHQGQVRIVKDIEHDAQAWACSVFYNAAPGLFKKAVKAGRIMGVTAQDLN